MKTKLSVIMCALAVSAYGCGSEDGSDGGGGTGGSGGNLTDMQRDAANAAVEQTLSLKAIAEDPTNAAAAASGIGLGGTLIGLFPLPSAPLTEANGTKGGGSGCPSDNTSPIVFENCDLGGGTLDGTITVDGDSITWGEFSVSVSGGLGVAVILDGSLDFSNDMIDGTIAYTVDTGVVSFGVTGVYDIELDGEGCPVGGSISATGDTAPYDTTVTANFGPNCGDVS